MKKLKTVLLFPVLLTMLAVCPGCEEGEGEKAGKEIDKQLEKAGDKVKDAADETKDAVKEGAEKVKDKVD